MGSYSKQDQNLALAGFPFGIDTFGATRRVRSDVPAAAVTSHTISYDRERVAEVGSVAGDVYAAAIDIADAPEIDRKCEIFLGPALVAFSKEIQL